MHDHESSGLPLNLIAQEALSVGDEQYSVGDRFECEPSTVAALVIDGKAKLFERQVRPPFEIIRACEQKLESINALGPVFLRETAIQHFEDSVTPGGLRRSTAGGKALHWKKGIGELERYMFQFLDLDLSSLNELSSHLEACWENQLGSSSMCCNHERYDSSKLLELGLVMPREQPTRPNWLAHGRMVEDAKPEYRYVDVGRDWAAFRHDLNALQDISRSIVAKALHEGRILAVVEKNGRSVLRAPWSWNKSTRRQRIPRGCYFLLSRDLPATWLPKAGQLRGFERELEVEKIKRELEKRYLATAPDHHLVRKQHVKREFVEKLGVSPTHFDSAWSAADIPSWSKGGRRPMP